jgi:integrase
LQAIAEDKNKGVEMPLRLKKQRDGKSYRPYWYGQYQLDGKTEVVNLNIPWRGVPPKTISDPGDAAFERSRALAEAELNRVISEARSKGRAEHLIERLIESKTGNTVDYVRLDELKQKWLAGGTYSEGYKAQCKAVFGRFLECIAERNPQAKFAYQVRPADVTAFMTEIRSEMSPATAKAYIGILRPAFDMCLPAGSQNPFRAGKRSTKKTAEEAKEGKGFHRIPFTPAELQAVLRVSESDPLLHGIITACACTGMRRGDVCKLKWKDVDLKAGLVVAKASKTGETVEVPIFEPLRKVLDAAKGQDAEYVFPDAAEMLAKNPDGLTWRFKKIVVEALSETKEKQAPLELPEGFDLKKDGVAKLRKALKPDDRRERIVGVFRAYVSGKHMSEVAEKMDCTKSTVAADLELAEKLVGAPVIRRRRESCIKKDIADMTRVTRERGKRSASVRDWHALRTTFVTLALSAGVPVELVKRVTGHQTTAIVMEHYFRPDREQFRAALVGALPEVLTGKIAEQTAPYGGVRPLGPGEQLEEARELLRGVTGKANQELVTRAMALIEDAKGWLDSHVVREG